MTDTTITYVAIICNSSRERSTVAYCGENKNVAEDRLYEKYFRLRDMFADEISKSIAHSPEYASKADFIRDATSNISSAYIQCTDFCINFELHRFVNIQKIHEYTEIDDEQLQKILIPDRNPFGKKDDEPEFI